MPKYHQRIPSPLKYHGGKHYLASKIVALMPAHRHYVEPYAGGLSTLLAKDPVGVSEVVNDIDGDLTNFWSVLRAPRQFPKFQRIAHATPFCEKIWTESRSVVSSPVERAVAFFVHCRQSMSGRMREFAPLSRTRTRRDMNEQVAAWLSAIEGLPAVHARLRQVVIYNRNALDVIRQQDGLGTLTYADPPYLDSERATPNVYRFEMAEADHVALLTTVLACRGYVMLSGYESALYNEALRGWQKHVFKQASHAGKGEKKGTRTEVVWCNFDADANRCGMRAPQRRSGGKRT